MRYDLCRVQDVFGQIRIAPCELRVVVVVEDQVAQGAVLVDDEFAKPIGRCVALHEWPRKHLQRTIVARPENNRTRDGG
ncbi:hypothetical protein D3C78_1666170 [compost metagenome]